MGPDTLGDYRGIVLAHPRQAVAQACAGSRYTTRLVNEKYRRRRCFSTMTMQYKAPPMFRSTRPLTSPITRRSRRAVAKAVWSRRSWSRELVTNASLPDVSVHMLQG